MATLAGLEQSLRQSARRGREVLERASRRKVDWAELPYTYTPVADDDRAVYSKKTMEELQEAFSTITEFMAETHIHCKRFYDSVGCSQGSNIEKKHVPRYHKHIGATKIGSSSQFGQHLSKSLWGDRQAYDGSESRSRSTRRLLHGGGSRIVHHQRQPAWLTGANPDDRP
ncbi:A-kinase-interacting protein 1 isoform X2 [Hippocampus zosterae]|uniref:A-kinase-interacting protein 1 isoform X2 n=1 Tax=Hippocampus zosterae TaxID=109293 RepID=UPI00223E8216|nr:A-kinase-interacting protein 1 isoform X2 [Hippocampus zosterae]XP_051916543.1 A-kinase-interacting protein 1 isoform X2 [Hippocampus zosterae]